MDKRGAKYVKKWKFWDARGKNTSAVFVTFGSLGYKQNLITLLTNGIFVPGGYSLPINNNKLSHSTIVCH